MQFEKKSVRLGDIRPSGQNPREDFGDSCFVGASSPRDIATIAAAGIDTVIEALRQVGIPYGLARKLMLVAVLGADPHGHADSIQTTDLDARREIRDMAAELGVDADI